MARAEAACERRASRRADSAWAVCVALEAVRGEPDAAAVVDSFARTDGGIVVRARRLPPPGWIMRDGDRTLRFDRRGRFLRFGPDSA